MSTRWPSAVVVGAGISGCLAALSLRRVLNDVKVVNRRWRDYVDFPMTIGQRLVEELSKLGLADAWDSWEGKRRLNVQLSAWGATEMGGELELVPSGPRYLVRRSQLESFLTCAVRRCGIKVLSALDPQSSEAAVIDATGRSGLIARRRGGLRRVAANLVARHGVGKPGSLPDASSAVQSGPDGWWFAAREHDHVSVMYLAAHSTHKGQPAPPPVFASLIGETRYQSAQSLASMSWLETASADNWFAVGEAALALDPVLGSGVDVAAQSAQLLRDALLSPEPHTVYNAAMSHIVAKHRIARHRLYGRAAAFHGGPFWEQQLCL